MNGSASCDWDWPTSETESTLRCDACLRGLRRVVAPITKVPWAGESTLDWERRLYGEVCEPSCEGDMVERVRVLEGESKVSATGVADAFDLVDLLVRFTGDISDLVGEVDVFVLDLVFLAGPVAGTEMVCNSPTL